MIDPEQLRRVADATAALSARFQKLGIAADEAAQAAERFITDLRAHGWRPVLTDPPPPNPRPASDEVRRTNLEAMRRELDEVTRRLTTVSHAPEEDA